MLLLYNVLCDRLGFKHGLLLSINFESLCRCCRTIEARETRQLTFNSACLIFCLFVNLYKFIYLLCLCVCVWRGGVIELGFDGYLLRLIVANNRIFAWISSSGLGITGNTAGELAFSVNQSMKCSLKYSSCPFEARIGRRYRLEQIPGTLMRVSRKLFICFDPVCGGNVSLEPNSPPGVSSIGRLKLFCALRASWSTPGGVSLISGWRFKPS